MSALAIAIALAGAASQSQSTDAVLRAYSECSTRQHSAQMHAMLDTRSEDGYRGAATSFSEANGCARRDEVTTAVTVASFNQDRGKLRGIIAESLLKRSKTVRQLAPLPQTSNYAASWTAMTGRLKVIDEMAMCVAAIDPAGVLRLLATKPNSGAQQQAFNALSPSLGSCLAKGYQLDSKPTAVRSALAEALYHRDTDSSNGSVKGS